MRVSQIITEGAKNSWYVGSAPGPAYAVKGALLQNPYRMVDVPVISLKHENGVWTHLPSGMRFKVVKDKSGNPSEGWAYRVYELE